ncbi:MAG: glycosyltransferase family 39 protein [Bacteroidetes bacterium]|nr:glycosyltransferase family 39 protein [Bacteroidota bacterium]
MNIFVYFSMSKQKEKSKKQGTLKPRIAYGPILSIAVLALIVRGVVMYDFSRSIFWSSVWMDSATYNDMAKSMVATGDWIGTQPFFMTPFYPYFLALLYSLFGVDLAVVRIAQMLLGSGTAVMVYLITSKLFSRKAAVIAGCLTAVYGPLVFFVNLLLVETVKVFFVTLSMYLALRARASLKLFDFLFCGLSLGVAILCRPTDALMVLPLILFLFYFSSLSGQQAVRYSAAVLLGITVAVAPVTIRNFVLSGEFIPVTSNGGLNFYIGNNAQAVGVYYNPEQFNLVHDPNGSGYLEHQYGKAFSPSETSSYWMEKATSYVVEQPGSFVVLLFRKFILFFHYKEIGQLGYGYDFMANHISSLLAYLPVFLIVMPLSMLGMVVTLPRWKELFLLHGFLWMQVAGVVLFFITDRYRLSALPFFIVFSGGGVEWLWNAIRQKKQGALVKGAAVIAAAVMGATILNYSLNDDFSTEYYNIGSTYFDAKRYNDAATAFQTSLSIKESHAVYNSLGNVYAAVGKYSVAQRMYVRANAMNPIEANSIFSIGTLFVRQQQWDSAIVYFNRALSINPRFAPARLNKGLTLFYLQRFSEALPELEAYVAIENDKTKTASVQRDIENLRRLIMEEQQSKK